MERVREGQREGGRERKREGQGKREGDVVSFCPVRLVKKQLK